jgi:hypothetical protein
MSQASINFANSAIEQVGERHKQLVESANAARFRSRSRNGKFTSRHIWTQGELTDVCRAFIINYKEKTLAEIAQEIHTRFTEYIKLQDHHRQAIVESDSDDELICQAHEYREGVPSISAIELKLIDCVNLCYQVSSGSCSKASKMHTEIWQHIMCAQKHREIIRTMKVATASTATTKSEQQQQDEPTTPKSSSSASLEAPGAPVKAKKTATPSSSRRKYLLESEEELPPAKRRKLNDEFEAAATTTIPAPAPAPAPAQQQQQRLSMSDICYALDEIADRMEQHGQCEQQYSHSVAQSIATIRQNQSDIALLMGYVQDTHTGIQKAHQRIEAELAKLETMTVVPAAATATAAPTATATKPKFDPSNYQCHECSQTFDPSIRGYWLIGAPCRNPNTTEAQEHEHEHDHDDEDDMFYLCRECTRFENEHNDNHNDMGDMAFGVMEDGEYDYDQYEDQYERARRGDYDHSEECS